MTTIDTLTDEQISMLQDEARAAGDRDQDQLCEEALCGHLWARLKVLKAINYAETQAADAGESA